MLTLLFHVCAVSSVSAFVIGGRPFTPNLRGSPVSMADVNPGMKPGQDSKAKYLTQRSKTKKVGFGAFGYKEFVGRIRFDGDKEEQRRNKLVTGTNWEPRTAPTQGKGYFFFQGPTPKTAYQEDLPSFFSAENFANLKIPPKLIAGLLAATISFSLLLLLIAGPPQNISPPSFNMQQTAPAAMKPKDAPAAKAPAAKAPAAKAPAAKAPATKAPAVKAPAKKDTADERKAAAEKVAAEKAAAKKATEETAAADKAAAAKAAAEKAAAEKAAKEKAAAEAAEIAKSPEQKAAEAKAKALAEAEAKEAANKAAAEKAAEAKRAAEKEFRELNPEFRDEPTADDFRAMIKKAKINPGNSAVQSK
jgi:hypothetical protein